MSTVIDLDAAPESTASGSLGGGGGGGNGPPHRKGRRVGRQHEKERAVLPEKRSKGQKESDPVGF